MIAVLAALDGDYYVERRPGYCLKFVRQVIEHAFNLPPYSLYKLVDKRSEPAHPGDVWSNDAEKSFRERGWAQHALKPGDLVFRFDISKPFGHVGIHMGHGNIAENTTAKRGKRYGGALAVTPLQRWGKPTTIIRLPDDLPSLLD